MKKYILLFVLAFAMAGVTNAQTTDQTIEAVKKTEAVQKTPSSEKAVTQKVAKAPSCKEMSKGCCKNKKGNAQASAEKKACCSNMAESKEGKACCDKMAEKMKAEKKEPAKKS